VSEVSRVQEPEPGSKTLTVTWHPDAVAGAVERVGETVRTAADPEATYADGRGGQVAWNDLACLIDLARTFLAMEDVTEHGVQMTGGGFHVRVNDPAVDRVYPLSAWIEHRVLEGNCWRRRVVVVEDWTEVTEP
jgi:hypothetical protein